MWSTQEAEDFFIGIITDRNAKIKKLETESKKLEGTQPIVYEPFNLHAHMEDSIKHMRRQDHLSLYGVLSTIVQESSNCEVFSSHASKILTYFNDFDNKTDDDNFMRCLLGQYKII